MDTTPSSSGSVRERIPSGVTLLSGSKYECVEYINRGANGFVVLALDVSKNKYYALKFIPIEYTKSKYVEREIVNQLKLKHPHVIKLEELFVTEDHLVLVLEYADKGDLFSYVKSKNGLSETTARWYFQQLILAVDFCHKMGVVNRDIKLENILLASSPNKKKMIKLSDFGFSKDETRHSAPNTKVGTFMYIAPEVITKLDSNSSEGYDARKSDVWSCGVVLYIMLTCRYPFKVKPADGSQSNASSIKSMHEVVRKTLGNEFEPVKNVSKECNRLIANMLESDPRKRYSVEQIMKDSWFTQDLSRGVVKFNDQVVQQLQQNPRVTDKTIVKIREMLQGRKMSIGPQKDMNIQ